MLLWLRTQAAEQLEIPAPEPEDWGWFTSVNWKGRSYLLGSSASEEEENGEREWVLQIVKHRSLSEKVFGGAKMGDDDECVQFFKQLIDREPAFREASIDP